MTRFCLIVAMSCVVALAGVVVPAVVDRAFPSDRAVVPSGSSLQAVSPVPASIPNAGGEQ